MHVHARQFRSIVHHFTTCHPDHTNCMNKESVLGDNSRESESEEHDQEIETVSIIYDLC